jgi:single-stranded DNA-binding protein
MSGSCLNENRMSGYLTRTPRLGRTKTGSKKGTPVFNSRMKVVRYYKKPGDDTWHEALIGYFDIVMFGGNAEEACGACDKGDQVMTDGGLATKMRTKYEKDGKTAVTYADGTEVEYPEVYIKAKSVELVAKAGSKASGKPGKLRQLGRRLKSHLS